MLTAAITEELTGLLLRTRNADGGWGYYARKASRLEPTCWALLALGAEADDNVLRRWPVADGLLLERAGGQPNYGFHGLALLTLLHRGIEHSDGNVSLIAGIQRVKGIALQNDPRFKQNNELQGWSWVPETFSWVEPTAYGLLALKKAQRAGISIDRQRIAEADALLWDRCCVKGGWNYGNSQVLGQDLPAYVPTTALALLALQDRASEPAFALSQDFLEKEALTESSAVALSLAAIALNVLDRHATEINAALLKQLPNTLVFASHQSIAMALFALRTDHRHAPFTL